MKDKNPRYFVIKESREDLKRNYPRFQYYVERDKQWYEKFLGKKESPSNYAKPWVDNTEESREISESEIALMF